MDQRKVAYHGREYPVHKRVEVEDGWLYLVTDPQTDEKFTIYQEASTMDMVLDYSGWIIN